MLKHFKRAYIKGGFSSVFLLALLLVPFAHTAASGAISQSYTTTSNDITAGALLSLTSADSKAVELANSATNTANLVGVAAEKPLVALSEGEQGTVQTVIGGTTQVLVSDVNGDVKAGDKITASPISGIGMKVVGSSGEIVGTAQADLDSVSTVRKTVEGEDGKDVSVEVGMVPVAVNVTYYSAASPASEKEGAASFVPPFLQDIANGVAGKPVSPLRVLVSTLALLLGFITGMLILYAGIRNSVVSLGRNPLAERMLRKELLNIVITAMGVLALTAVIVYIVLLG